jgi:hypothetical protein
MTKLSTRADNLIQLTHRSSTELIYFTTQHYYVSLVKVTVKLEDLVQRVIKKSSLLCWKSPRVSPKPSKHRYGSNTWAISLSKRVL